MVRFTRSIGLGMFLVSCAAAVSIAVAACNPTAKGTWTATGSLIEARFEPTATLLKDGKVLIAGGFRLGPLAGAELYDPATGSWAATAPLLAARNSHTATLLPDGRVLIAGGEDGTAALASADLYDPATKAWTATGAMLAPGSVIPRRLCRTVSSSWQAASTPHPRTGWPRPSCMTPPPARGPPRAA